MRNLLFILLIVGFAVFAIAGCERSQTSLDVVVQTETPTADDPEAFTRAFVQEMIDLYESQGIEATAAYYNDPANVGEQYVFIADENDLLVAHPPRPDSVGMDIKDVMVFNESSFGAEIAKATEKGLWNEFLLPNQALGKFVQLTVWSIRHDGYLFGAGHYRLQDPDPAMLSTVFKDNTEAFTRAFVQEMTDRYESQGIEATAAYYNDPANVGEQYVFIADENDLLVTHPPRPDSIGMDIKDVMVFNESSLGAEIAKATEKGLWNEFLLPNQALGKFVQFTVWSIRHDGYLFGAGYYMPLPEGIQPAVEGTGVPAVN